MNSITLDITDILSQDLKSRSTVTDLRVFIEHQQAENVMIDFSKVLFATRSFIDEYYNRSYSGRCVGTCCYGNSRICYGALAQKA